MNNEIKILKIKKHLLEEVEMLRNYFRPELISYLESLIMLEVPALKNINYNSFFDQFNSLDNKNYNLFSEIVLYNICNRLTNILSFENITITNEKNEYCFSYEKDDRVIDIFSAVKAKKIYINVSDYFFNEEMLENLNEKYASIISLYNSVSSIYSLDNKKRKIVHISKDINFYEENGIDVQKVLNSASYLIQNELLISNCDKGLVRQFSNLEIYKK